MLLNGKKVCVSPKRSADNGNEKAPQIFICGAFE